MQQCIGLTIYLVQFQVASRAYCSIGWHHRLFAVAVDAMQLMGRST